MLEIGDITYLKNICFYDGKIDHAFNRGRPCIFLGELDDKMYFIPLVSAEHKKMEYIRKINPDKENCLKKISNPNIHSLIEKPVAFYETSGNLNFDDIKMVFSEICSYYKVIIEKRDEILLKLANNYFNNIKYVDKDLNNEKNLKSKITL